MNNPNATVLVRKPSDLMDSMMNRTIVQFRSLSRTWMEGIVNKIEFEGGRGFFLVTLSNGERGCIKLTDSN